MKSFLCIVASAAVAWPSLAERQEASSTTSPPSAAQNEPQPRRAKFYPKQYEPYLEPGDSEVVGQAFMIKPNGERIIASRKVIFMNPVTSYSNEWYVRSIIRGETLETADTRADDFHWVVRTDYEGHFRIPCVPEGEYYIGCRVLADEPFVHAEIKVGEDETVEVILARDVGDDGVHYSTVTRSTPHHAKSAEAPVEFGRPNPEAPRELAQWAQLVGVWDCTIPVVDAEGNARIAKGTWTWTYAFGGTAILDTYLGHRPSGSDFHGGALRAYDPVAGEWEVAWIDNGPRPDDATTMIRTYRATFEDGAIIMRKPGGDPNWRTTFYNITAESFDWITEPSQQRMHCWRIDGPAR